MSRLGWVLTLVAVFMATFVCASNATTLMGVIPGTVFMLVVAGILIMMVRRAERGK